MAWYILEDGGKRKSRYVAIFKMQIFVVSALLGVAFADKDIYAEN